MRLNLFSSLSACLCLAACADHAGSVVTNNANPQAPINQPDGGAIAPGLTPTGGATGSGENGAGGGGSGGTSGAGSGGSGGSGSGPSGGGVPTGGGQPVPEPGTLLLVGTGLAGAALLRRRRNVKA